MVRGVGPRVPLHRARARRSGFRQGTALAAAVRAVPASERPDPRVRVGVLRSQSAGACLGVLARLQHGPHRTGRADREFLEKCFHKLLINFTWWVNKVDSRGQQRLRRRLPRARQHHRLRSQRAAARRRDPRAERRHRLDGDVLPGHDAHRAGAGEARIASTKALATKFFEHYVYIGAAMKMMGGREYQLWDDEDGFFYDVLRFPDGAVPQVPRPLAGRADSALRDRAARARSDRAVRVFRENCRLVHEEPRRPRRHCVTTGRRQRQARTCSPSSIRISSQHLLAARRRSGRVPLAVRHSQPVEVSSASSPSSSAMRPSRYEPAKRRRNSRAATATGAARSGSRLPTC